MNPAHKDLFAGPKTLVLRCAWGVAALSPILFYLSWFDPQRATFAYPLLLPAFLAASIVQELTSGIKWLKLGGMLFFAACTLPLVIWQDLNAIARLTLFIQLAFLAGARTLAHRFFERANEKITAVKDDMAQNSTRLRAVEEQNSYYQDRQAKLKEQIGARQMLSSFTREMGTLLDPEKIQQKLTQQVQMNYPEEKTCFIASNFSSDPAAAWSYQKKISLLIKDAANDPRFPFYQKEGNSSSILAPLIIENSVIGIVRVDSNRSARFVETDLRRLELYAHLSILALENAKLFSQVNALATKDALTGLATHRVFQERLSEEILRAARYHTELSLIMFDIDHFKLVNDQYGHLTGDSVLRDVSQIISQHNRNVDFAARYGGEEFVIILPQTAPITAFALAENLRKAVESHNFRSGPTAFTVTASIGCSSFPGDAQIASQLIRRADERLYRAKSSGRNRVVNS